MMGILAPIFSFIRSTVMQLIWWVAVGFLMVLLKHAPLIFRLGPPLVSVALLACLPSLLERGKEIKVGLRPSTIQYILLTVQRSFLVLFFIWSWRDSAAAWFIYGFGAIAACYTVYEVGQVARVAREVREHGVDKVARDRIAVLMAKDPSDPFRKVREYCFEMRKTDVEYRLSEAIGERMDHLWERMKEYQRAPSE